MNANLEPQGIIAQSVRHLAEHGKPLDVSDDSGMFQQFIYEMVRHEKDKDKRDEYLARLKETVIGRVATRTYALPSGKIQTTTLAVLGESVGIMPDYVTSEHRAKKIGAVLLDLHSSDRHTHPDDSFARHQSRLTGHIDILTSGEVNANLFRLEACNPCGTVDITDEAELLGRLGLDSLYAAPEKHIVDNDHNGSRHFTLVQSEFSADQVGSLQDYLHETFPLDR